MRLLSVLALIFLSLAPLRASPAFAAETEGDYAAEFAGYYGEYDPPLDLKEAFTPAGFDAQYMPYSGQAHFGVDNERGGMAWGSSYHTMALNAMYRTTGSVKYLEDNLEWARKALELRDDARGVALYDGSIAPAWGSIKYSESTGRTCWLVHTGMIAYPFLDLLTLIAEEPNLLASLGGEFATLKAAFLESVDYHAPQWREGPGQDEGHFTGSGGTSVEGMILPGNQMSAMGRALWTAWKLTGDTDYRDRARRLAAYQRARLYRATDGAYYWSYWLPIDPVDDLVLTRDDLMANDEDSSHAGLAASFYMMMAMEDGTVFARGDLAKFARTCRFGFGRRGDGILFSGIAGSYRLTPNYIGLAHYFTATAQENPIAWEPLANYFRRFGHNYVLEYPAIVGLVQQDADGDGIPDAVEGGDDTDGDGIPDYLDTDADGDGLPDSYETAADPDFDAIASYLDDRSREGFGYDRDGDADGDGLTNGFETDADPDEDGIPNSLDQDSDGDGIFDLYDERPYYYLPEGAPVEWMPLAGALLLAGALRFRRQ